MLPSTIWGRPLDSLTDDDLRRAVDQAEGRVLEYGGRVYPYGDPCAPERQALLERLGWACAEYRALLELGASTRTAEAAVARLRAHRQPSRRGMVWKALRMLFGRRSA